MSALTYLEHLGDQLLEAGDYEVAWAQYLHVLSLREKNLMTKSSDLEISHPHLAACSNNLGALHKEMGNLARSLQYYQQALTLWQRQPRRYRDEIAMAQNNVGAILCQTSNWAAARPYLEQALKTHPKPYCIRCWRLDGGCLA